AGPVRPRIVEMTEANTSRLLPSNPNMRHLLIVDPMPRCWCAGLRVVPDASRPDVGDALAPRGDRAARVRDRDLAVVPVDLGETVLALVVGPGGRVRDPHRRAPVDAAVVRAAVVHVPRVGIVAAGRLHVPGSDVSRASGLDGRRRGVLAGDR